MQIEKIGLNFGILLDAGVFIGALLKGDSRHKEARIIVENARQGIFRAFSTTGILSEVYGALTWEKAQPRHNPIEAAEAVKLLIEPPSSIIVLEENVNVIMLALQIAAKHKLTARRIHDARHGAAALTAGISKVCTYDKNDWQAFSEDGVEIIEPNFLMLKTTIEKNQ